MIQKPKILVIDNDKNTQGLLSCFLQDGYSVVPVTELKEAFNLIKKNDIDLVITEMNFKDGDAIDFIEHMLDPGVREVPVIIFTDCNLSCCLGKQSFQNLLTFKHKKEGVKSLRKEIEKKLELERAA